MTEPAQTAEAGSPNGKLRRSLPVVFSALAIWLGWQIVRGPVVAEGPPEVAARLAPASPTALNRAAQAEFAAGRPENARELAALSLQRAPFNVPALRVLGLATAAQDAERADRILTIAGNFSLRDTPTHAWLVERKLRLGDYRLAFGHADALARRSADFRPRIFELFNTAITYDPQRALPAVAERLAHWPGWRDPYLASLSKGASADPQILAQLALALQTASRPAAETGVAPPPPPPLSDAELRRVYGDWLNQGRLEAVLALRTALARPGPSEPLVDGDFAPAVPSGGSQEAVHGVAPFAWTATTGPGLTAEVAEDPGRADETALRVDYDGFAAGVAATQVLTATPGGWRLTGVWRGETPGDSRLSWAVRCLETGAVLGRVDPGVDAGRTPPSTGMTPFTLDFSVPAGCRAQSLTLAARPGDRRRPSVIWFDALKLTPQTSEVTRFERK